MAYCEKCRFEFRFRHSVEECERAIADRAKEKAYFEAKREEAEKGLAERVEKERHESMVRRLWSENDRSNRRDPLDNTSSLAPPSAYQRPGGARGVMETSTNDKSLIEQLEAREARLRLQCFNAECDNGTDADPHGVTYQEAMAQLDDVRTRLAAARAQAGLIALPYWCVFEGPAAPPGISFPLEGLVAIEDLEPSVRAEVMAKLPPLPRAVRLTGQVPGLVWRGLDGRYPVAQVGLGSEDPRAGKDFDVFNAWWSVRGVSPQGEATIEFTLPLGLFKRTVVVKTGIEIEPALEPAQVSALLKELVVGVVSDDTWTRVDVRTSWVRKGRANDIRRALANALTQAEPLPPECGCGTVMHGDPPACEHHGFNGP